MANFREVNKAIKADFPNIDIQVVRGDGYVYFDGEQGFDKIPSIMVNPVATTTETLINLCYQEISDVLAKRVEAMEEQAYECLTDDEGDDPLDFKGFYTSDEPERNYGGSYLCNLTDTYLDTVSKVINKIKPSRLRQIKKLSKYMQRVSIVEL